MFGCAHRLLTNPPPSVLETVNFPVNNVSMSPTINHVPLIIKQELIEGIKEVISFFQQ